MTPRMTALWWIVGAGLAGSLLVAMMRLLKGRSGSDDELSDVVLRGFADTWAQRLGTDEEAIRLALLDPNESSLRAKIAAEVGIVDVKLTRIPGPGRKVAASLLCDYVGGRQRSTAEFNLDWDDIPADLRAEFVRSGRGEVFRKWVADVASPRRAEA